MNKIKKIINRLKNFFSEKKKRGLSDGRAIRLREIPGLLASIIRREGLIKFCLNIPRYIAKLIKKITFSFGTTEAISVDDLFRNKFPNIHPLESINTGSDEPRINIVTDSVAANSLLGGVATALILATLYANKNNVKLRIITRECGNNPIDFENFLMLMDLKKPRNVEFFTDQDRNKGKNRRLEVTDGDIFLATSWWSTYVIRNINLKKNIFYIIQEVESFFYPNSDEQYFCNKILASEGIKFIVNSKLLWDYYENSNANIIENGIYFEPAFPERLYSPDAESFKKKKKYNLFFYSRPKNPRNLFYVGIKLLDRAIATGIINKDEWDIYFAGSDVPNLRFSNGTKPILHGQMNWEKYKKFASNIDLGFCLMYTPHPSYPPLDIAASGGVVLTNKYLNKEKLNYSENIICADLDENSMVEGFKKAISLAKNNRQREENFKNNAINRSWDVSFKEVLEFMEKNK